MDKIQIQGLEIFANHGVFPEENVLGQKFVINAVLYTDTRKSGKERRAGLVHPLRRGQSEDPGICGRAYPKLLESVAEGLAAELLLTVPHLKKIKLEIQKPWAPVHLPLKTVSVEIERGWHKAYIALGSNMGDRKAHLQRGVEMLRETEGCRVGQVSDFITTAPYGYLEQEDFLNGCLELDTLLTPEELLERLHEIEQAEKRERKIHWGPRTLDLDIIFYDDLVLDSEVLHIPHIEMHKRDFVLKPLNQIAPWVRHPLLKKTVREMAAGLEAAEESAG